MTLKQKYYQEAMDYYRQGLKSDAIAAQLADEDTNVISLGRAIRTWISELNTEVKEPEPEVDLSYQEFMEWKKGKVVTNNKSEKDKRIFNEVGLHIVLGCWHVPFHNKKLTKGVLNLIKDIQPVGFHLLGDFLDLNTLSSHDRGNFPVIKGLTINQEYKEGNAVLDQFEEALPDSTEKSYVYGNHENRWQRYMANMQSAKTPLESPTEALFLRDRGYHVHENWSQDSIELGKHLELIHGTYYNVHCAKKHMDVLRTSIMFAHCHRIQTYIEGNTGAFAIGCGIDLLSPAFNYAPKATKGMWQNGFSVVYIDEMGRYFVTQIIVEDDKFVFGGKMY